jgi:hypothetical protein
VRRRAVDHPVVYGSPAQIAVLLDSITRVIESEPDEVFENPGVRQSGRQLSGVIDRRVAEAFEAGHTETVRHERPGRAGRD